MQSVTDRFKANLRGARWLPSVEFSNDGTTWAPARIAGSAKVTTDSKSQVRWAGDLALVDPGRDVLHAYGTLVRCQVGLVYSPGDVEWVRLGLMRVETANRTWRDGLVKVRSLSLEQSVVDDEFHAVRVIDGGPARAVLERLIRETIPEANVVWRVSQGLTVARITTEDTSRWGVIDGGQAAGSIARALGARVYCDAAGSFIVADVPTLDDPAVAVVDEGPGGLLLTASEELTRKGVFNTVSVRGESTDSTSDPVGPCVVADTDPLSPTFAGGSPLRGGFGPSVYHYTSRFITTDLQGYKAARGLLAPLLGLKQQIGWQSVFDPSLEAGDVVLARSPAGLTPTLVDSLEFDLAGFTMTGSCRQTQTRLAGDVQLAVASEQEGG